MLIFISRHNRVYGMLRVAIIGVGRRARAHIETLRKLHDLFKIEALCDVDRSRLGIAKEIGASAYTSVREMLSEVKPDVALVAVQAEGHHVVTKVLMDSGIHILCETPIAISLKCAREMIRWAEKSGVYLEVSENVPRWPRERLKRKIIEAGLLGGLKDFYLSYTSGSYHGMAAIRHLIGSEALKVRGEFPELNSVFERGYITFPEVEGVYELNAVRGNYWEIRGEKGLIRKMEVQIDGVVYPIKIEFSREGPPRITGAYVDTKPPVRWENPLKKYPLTDEDDVARADAWLSLYNAIDRGEKLNYGAENALKDLELLIAVRESAMRGGAELRLPLGEDLRYDKLVHEEFRKAYGLDPLRVTLEHLSVKYTIPERLQQLLYYGRLDAWKSSKYRLFYPPRR